MKAETEETQFPMDIDDEVRPYSTSFENPPTLHYRPYQSIAAQLFYPEAIALDVVKALIESFYQKMASYDLKNPEAATTVFQSFTQMTYKLSTLIYASVKQATLKDKATIASQWWYVFAGLDSPYKNLASEGFFAAFNQPEMYQRFAPKVQQSLMHLYQQDRPTVPKNQHSLSNSYRLHQYIGQLHHLIALSRKLNDNAALLQALKSLADPKSWALINHLLAAHLAFYDSLTHFLPSKSGVVKGLVEMIPKKR